MPEKPPIPDHSEKNCEESRLDKIFELNPELLEIGTKEQYREYLKTIFPESKIRDVVFHDTEGDWFKIEGFDEGKIGKTDYGYYGKGFYFHTQEDITGSYGERTFVSVLNIQNPKYNIDTHTVGQRILSGQNPEESKKIATTWLSDEIAYYENEITKLNKGEIDKHHDIPEGMDFEDYWENERLSRIDAISKLIQDYHEQLKNIDALISEYYSHDGFLTGDDTSKYGEIIVRQPEQIHTLGSESDKEGFRHFVSQELVS